MKRAAISLLALVLCCSFTSLARAEGEGDARAHFDRATSAFALGHFADAAIEYEKAFELKSDPALLFNAAQAHRHAGNKQRALLLYQNYLRIFGQKAPNRAEVTRQVAELKEAIEHEPAQPVVPAPVEKPAEPAQPVAPVATPVTAEPAIVAAPPPRKPLVKKAWFWGVIAGSAVVVGTAIALGIVFGSTHKDPTATLGSVQVNN